MRKKPAAKIMTPVEKVMKPAASPKKPVKLAANGTQSADKDIVNGISTQIMVDKDIVNGTHPADKGIALPHKSQYPCPPGQAQTLKRKILLPDSSDEDEASNAKEDEGKAENNDEGEDTKVL
jgi:hypothetical protein